MKDFNDFLGSLDRESAVYDVLNNLDDIPPEQCTMSKEEWQLITKLIINSQTALLRQYHNWLSHQDTL